jgi:CopG family nickel-responsive transcriptional regulator
MLKRFSVSIDKLLIEQFDSFIKKNKFANRSQAIGHLVREALVGLEWEDNKEVAGALTLVYDHHKRDLVKQLLGIQHDFTNNIISSQHVHLDHKNCLEIIVVKGKAKQIRELLNRLKSIKGLKHIALTATTTGAQI